MMTLTQAETEVYRKIGQFDGVEKNHIQIENQPLSNGQPFIAPTKKPWCRVVIQYADSRIVGIGDAPCVRDQGYIAIQCFTPKDKGTIQMTNLCDAWRSFLQSFNVGHFEIYKVHAPQSMDDQDFYAKIIRAEFRVN